jgi:hypothetical protein
LQRTWAVRPDPETGVADRQQIIEALMDGEALLHRAGGVLSVVVHRAITDLPGEMVTTAAVFEWKDRTDGHTKPQPERATSNVARQPEPVPELDPTPAELEDRLTSEEEFLARAEAEEDMSSMEPTAR